MRPLDHSKISSNPGSLSENSIILNRKKKLQSIRDLGQIAFPNDFKPQHQIQVLHAQYQNKTKDELANESVRVSIAGRIVLKRVMGQAGFIQIQATQGQLQVYLKQSVLLEKDYSAFKEWDLGDIVGIEGDLFKTNTDELTVRARKIELLTKSLRPLPNKFHGLHNTEQRYRQRYVDLIANPNSKKIFKMRSDIVHSVRNFFTQAGFMEVETPMMQSMPGGAAARPFVTHHQALDLNLYLRIAPELFLKRLIVGGFEKVFELNRNFRNEGISAQHNPEFTMLEFYQAYADYQDLMCVTEQLFQTLTQTIFGKKIITYQGHTLDFQRFERLTMLEAILKFNATLTLADLKDRTRLRLICERYHIAFKPEEGIGKLQLYLFEKTVETQLIQPTFITAYPTEVSPLSRRNNGDPNVTDRFEFFVAGFEIANGFSELNDPDDQAERFLAQAQARTKGDPEAMHYDQDYIRALEYGLPPTAGEGIGIDRLVMLLTDSASIRDVLLFPYMRPESSDKIF